MARVEKTVFISYRRKDVSWALAVYQDLTHQGYDVFFDYTSIPSGDFEQIIISNIKARAHFVLILTPTTLDRCDQPGDWLRREIETAIDEKRNIIPLFFNGFSFGSDNVSKKLTGKLRHVSRYNGMNVHQDYFHEAMARLRTKFLNIPLTAVLHPISAEVQEVVLEEQRAANEAAEKVNAIAKQEAIEARKKKQKEFIDKISKLISSNIRRFGIGGIILIGIIGILFAGNYFLNNLPENETPEITPTKIIPVEFTVASTFAPTTTATKSLAISTTTRFDIGSTIFGSDDMLLMYVPASEFTMGSDYNSDEKPIHQVNLDAYWIDQTEVTNEKYTLCVNIGRCKSPSDSELFLNEGYANHPVIYVSWEDAQTYCEWAGRRLPTEAEWEKAARGPDGNLYPWGNNAPASDLLNYDNEIGETTEVGNYPQGASIYGALDMAGNVWEWVSSLYEPYPYYSNDGREDLSSSEVRALRGGGWSIDKNASRSPNRIGNYPTDMLNDIGFRCAMDGE